MNVRMVEFTLTSSEVRTSGYEDLEFISNNFFMTIVGGNIRYSYSPGQNPTPTSGHRYYQGAPIEFNSLKDVANFRMIAESNDVFITITHKA